LGDQAMKQRLTPRVQAFFRLWFKLWR
jgi:hypothetical protein